MGQEQLPPIVIISVFAKIMKGGRKDEPVINRFEGMGRLPERKRARDPFFAFVLNTSRRAQLFANPYEQV